MKRIMIGLLLISFLLYGCASSNVNETTASSSGLEDVSSISDEEINSDALLGTYVGLHGSAITFLSDGTAEYFWKEWSDVEINDKWEINGQRISLHSNSLNYDIYADLSDSNTSYLNFQSESKGWEDEIFVKVSDDANSKDTDMYVALIEEQLHTTLERPDNTTTITVGGFEFKIPQGYELYEKEDDYLSYLKGETALLLFMWSDIDADTLKNVANNQSKFESYMDEACDELIIAMIDSDDILISKKVSDDAKPEGSIGKTVHYSFSDGDENGIIYGTWAANISSGDYIVITYLNTETNNSDEFIDLINNGKVIESEVEDNEEKDVDAEATSKQSSGVSPDLKEYLDSYEAFIDEYVEFMNQYYNNPTDLSLLSKYADILQKYNDFAEAIDNYDTDIMSTDDYNYYIEVTTRCTQKLLKIGTE